MTRSATKLVCRGALVLACATGTLHAQVINLSTGLSNGAPLAAEAIDLNWQTLHAGEATFFNHVVSDAINSGCGCGIIPNAPTAQWINITGAANSGWPVGLVNETFRSFSLVGYDLSTVTLTGKWAAMDSNLGLFLNGALIPGTTFLFPGETPWTSLHSFSISGASNFRSGFNEISFHSTTTNGVFDGVLLRDGFVRSTVVPEPGSFVLLTIGFAGFVLAARRRRPT